MKKLICTLFFAGLSCIDICAQSKNELKETISKLTMENTELKARLQRLETDYNAVKAEYAKMQERAADPLRGDNDAETSIYTVVHNFFAGKTSEQRFKYVIQSEATKNAMRKLYVNGCEILNLTANDMSILSSDLTTENAPIFVNYWGSEGRAPAVVKKTADGYKLDFENTVVYNSPGLKQLELGNVSGDVVLKIWGSNVEEDNEAWWVMYASDASSILSVLLYFPKDSNFASKLVDMFSDGSSHAITVKAKYDEDSIVITQFIKEGF